MIEALGHQLKVYNYSSEKAKMFVPFARLLRMWDEHPEDFDAYETHSLHWVFKWMSAGMLDQPHIPLASIEKWLGEMEHRYRLAGHSERAVRSAEFSVAAHVGDRARAERAFAAWLAADRDAMADCHACELHGQGWWHAELGRDEEALQLWEPVLEGAYTCAHEPHTALASSLLPLLRLGRVEEARAHHLRGFRLVRAMESMRGAYADHVEFCALTGNEARGLELLAERPAYFTDDGQPQSKLDFLGVVALLMDRLVERGLGGQTVPGPAGRTWTAAGLSAHARGEALALAARFDARNGTSYVSERLRDRMARRPLVERLPLGVRAVRPAAVAPAPVPAAPAEPPGSRTTWRRCWSGPGSCRTRCGRTPWRRGPRSHGPPRARKAPGARCWTRATGRRSPTTRGWRWAPRASRPSSGPPRCTNRPTTPGRPWRPARVRRTSGRWAARSRRPARRSPSRTTASSRCTPTGARGCGRRRGC